MTKVFIGGSRRVSRLNEQIRKRLDRIVEKRLPVLLGDANGADKAVQQYLHGRAYENVEIFCSGNSCRNNVGHWTLREVPADSRNRDFNFYAAKDRVMAREATVGFMVWDGKSIGTLLNVLRLVKLQKNAIVYVVSDGRFWEIKNQGQWEDFISHCGVEIRNEVERRAALEEPAEDDSSKISRQMPLPLSTGQRFKV